MLPAQCQDQLVQHRRKTDTGLRRTELTDQSVVAASLDKRIARPVRISAENDAGIVIVLAEHAQIDRDIFLKTVFADGIVNLLEVIQHGKRLRALRHGSGPFNRVVIAEKLRQCGQYLCLLLRYMERLQERLRSE